jgi:hypothetical protein
MSMLINELELTKLQILSSLVPAIALSKIDEVFELIYQMHLLLPECYLLYFTRFKINLIMESADFG